MKISFSKRIVSFVLCLTVLLAGFAYKPQKAEAFAISASVVASVIMIMTACGVTFWASTQGDAESYISEKLGEYMDQLTPTPASILDWLGITDLGSLFVVLTGGVARFDSNVANRILDFIRWFNQEEGVVSGGVPVGILGAPVDMIVNDQSGDYGSVSPVLTSDNTIQVTFSDIRKRNIGSFYYVSLHLPGITGYTVTVLDVDAGNTININRSSFSSALTDVYRPTQTGVNVSYVVGESYTLNASDSKDYLALAFSNPNKVASYEDSGYNWAVTLGFNLRGASDLVTDDEVSVTPSEAVSVPDALSDDESYSVAPSVPLTEGMSVDDASSEIFEGVVSQDGLTSDSSIDTPPLVDLSGIESRLDAIEAALIALDDAVDSVDGDTSDIQGSIATLLSRTSSIQNSIATLDNNLDNVDDNVNDVALAVSGISGKIDNLESDVAGLVGSLGSISQGNSDIQDSIAGLSSAMSALSADMELVKDALAGLTANDSLVDDVADIKTNTSGLSGLLSSIQYYVERVVEVLLDFFSGFFDNLASAFIDLINSLKAMLLDLFIPDEAFVDAFVADLQFKMDNHFSILSYPFSLLGRFIGESALQTEGDGILSWPDIYEPFSHTLLIHAGSYRIYDVVDEYGNNFYRIYDIYRIVLQGYITFDFISYLYFWFCDVFKMRELDFPNPLEVEE